MVSLLPFSVILDSAKRCSDTVSRARVGCHGVIAVEGRDFRNWSWGTRTPSEGVSSHQTYGRAGDPPGLAVSVAFVDLAARSFSCAFSACLAFSLACLLEGLGAAEAGVEGTRAGAEA